MTKEQKDTLFARTTSVGFSILAFIIFKPFRFNELGWMVYDELGGMVYLHYAMLWALGVGICYVTEAVLNYILHLPASLDKGAEYIIRRNLWFQLINTPLQALVICVYFHFVMRTRGLVSPLSWKSYLSVLLLIAFCSFAIGLYRRFKYRSKYLKAELEETRLLNTQLQKLQQEAEQRTKIAENEKAGDEIPQVEVTPPPSTIVLKGTTAEIVTVQIPYLLYIEAVGNYVKVHQLRDDQVRSEMLRATLKQIEDDLRAYPTIVRCHRAYLVNLQQVEQAVSKSGAMQLIIKHCEEALPVSRSNVARMKEAIAC